MPSKTIEHQCPACGGGLKFDSASQTVKCPYCDTEYDVKALVDDDNKTGFNQELKVGEQQSEYNDEESSGLGVYRCSNCGSEIIANENTTSTLCPYCDTPIILSSRLKGVLKPDYVIPFKIDKFQVRDNLEKYLKKKFFLPKIFKQRKIVDEVRSIYVPFWLYDTDLSARLTFKAETHRTWSDNNYEYRETKFYRILREGDIAFDYLPVNGSIQFADDICESIEPFDFSEAVPFNTGYLSGFNAEKYDMDSEQCSKRAKTRIEQGTVDKFRTTIHGYDNVTLTGSYYQINKQQTHYALYPVWTFSVNYNDKRYRYGVNGQTGKVVGEMPLDKLKVFLFSLLFFALFGAIGSLITFLANEQEFDIVAILVGLFVGLIAMIIFIVIIVHKYKPVRLQSGARDYYRKDSLNIKNRYDIYVGHRVSRTPINRNNK